MGRLLGTFDLEIDGSGIIHGRKFGSILHSWSFPASYRLDSNHHLRFIEQELYSMNTRVTMKDTLNLQRSPDDTETILTLYPGQKATIIGSDNKKWCLIETNDGLKGWFGVEKYSQIVGTGKEAIEIFEGLTYN
jgi:hypothetical protein